MAWAWAKNNCLSNLIDHDRMHWRHAKLQSAAIGSWSFHWRGSHCLFPPATLQIGHVMVPMVIGVICWVSAMAIATASEARELAVTELDKILKPNKYIDRWPLVAIKWTILILMPIKSEYQSWYQSWLIGYLSFIINQTHGPIKMTPNWDCQQQCLGPRRSLDSHKLAWSSVQHAPAGMAMASDNTNQCQRWAFETFWVFVQKVSDLNPPRSRPHFKISDMLI